MNIQPNIREDAIVFDRVGLSFGNEAIYDQMSFSVRRGEFVCLLGPSGCGKSTSLRLVGDLLAAQTGNVRVDGLEPSQAWQQVAFVFQSPRLAPWRNALDNVLLGVELRMGAEEARRREPKARELLSLVGLSDSARKYPSMLSGGERQRVAIARALAVDPAIVLMDEPFSALDPNTRRRLRAEIESIWQRTGRTILFVTHDIEEAIVLADRIVLLSNKPTRVLESITVESPRPRKLAGNTQLETLRERLQLLFQSLEANQPEDTP
jgi:NitT/TauT family transport system ATP-binding protein